VKEDILKSQVSSCFGTGALQKGNLYKNNLKNNNKRRKKDALKVA
jgi:hypothetical protein